jgi:hypothetical protein
MLAAATPFIDLRRSARISRKMDSIIVFSFRFGAKLHYSTLKLLFFSIFVEYKARKAGSNGFGFTLRRSLYLLYNQKYI